MKTPNIILYFILCLGTWLLLTSNLNTQNLVAGVIISMLTTAIFARYFDFELDKLLNPVRWFWAIVYIIYFIWECVKANFDVAYRVLHPLMPVKPGILRVKLGLKGSMARTILANSITMTPGTISVDIIDDTLYVHCIYIGSTDPDKYSYRITGKFERLLTKIFE